MSVRASTVVIGGFVVGAVALAVAAVLLFGGGRVFKRTTPYLLNFQGSVAGLNVGAPVVLQGVKVGTVVSVTVELLPDQLTFRTPVVVEIGENIGISGGERTIEEAARQSGGGRKAVQREIVRRLVDKGLRARLAVMSMITNQLMVEFVMLPDAPPASIVEKDGYMELPTALSDIERLRETLEKIPVVDIARQIQETLASVNEVITSPEFRGSLRSMARLLAHTDSLSAHWSRRASKLAADLTSVLDNLDGITGETRGRIGPLLDRLDESSRLANEAIATMNRIMTTMEPQVGENSPLLQEMRTSLKSLTRAADSYRSLAEYLNQRPEALLRGK